MATRDPIVLLHGFAGTGASWDGVRAHSAHDLITPDLPGHGARAHARPVTFDTCVAAVLEQAPARFVLGGYSQGGRVGLHVALAAPERVSGLVLIATTAGLEDDAERAARSRADHALADDIERDGLETFADHWTAQPLFADDPPEAVADQRAQIARQTAAGLAAALRGIGTGEMAPLWSRLRELTVPAVVMAGERDAKYLALAERLAGALPDARTVIVPGAGHGLPREAPAAIAGALSRLRPEP